MVVHRARTALILVALFGMLLAGALIGTSRAVAVDVEGDQWVGHDPKTGIWTMPDGRTFYYGDPADQPIMCDWDGDGIDTVGLYRSRTGFLHLRQSNSQGFSDIQIYYGIPEDLPICGDWDGDGTDTIGIYRPSERRFYLRNTNTQGFADIDFEFSHGGGTPVAGDWNGDGIDTVGLDARARGSIALAAGNTPVMADVISFGVPEDALITGDWNDDGVDTFGVIRADEALLSLPGGIVSVDANVRGNPVAARVTSRVPNGIITHPIGEVSVTQGDSLPVAGIAFSDRPVSLSWRANGPAGSLIEESGSAVELGPMDETGLWTIALDASFDNGVVDPTPATLTVSVAPGPAPTVTSIVPAAGTGYRVGESLDLEAQATGYGPLSFEWTFPGTQLPTLLGNDPAPIELTTPGTLDVGLTVTDRFGRQAFRSFSLTIDNEILISPGESIQEIIDANPGPHTFVLAPGVHRGQSVRMFDSQTLMGMEGAILSGAKVLTNWQYDAGSDAWFVDGQTQQGRVSAEWVVSGPVCRETNPRCRYPEDLFIDGQVQRHVTWIGDLADGTWWFDYDSDKIWVKSDPREKFVETSYVEQGIYGGADSVTVRDLIIEKYATPTQVGAIDSRLYATGAGPDGTDWTIDNVEARYNHGTGIFVTDGGHILNSFAHHNGQQGFSARGHDVVVESSELSHNNTAGYHWDFESGGGKYYRTYNMVFRDNRVHDNYGSGVWFDIANFDALIEDNVVEDNDFDGIFYEVSYGAVIRNNIVTGNGFLDERGVWLWGAGITVASSSDVEIYGNEVRDNWNGISAVEQQRGTWEGNPREVTNLWVHDNLVSMAPELITQNPQYTVPANGYVGLGVDYGDTSFYTSRGNRFTSNDYELPAGASLFHWLGIPRDWATWQAYGQDLEGTITYVGTYTP